MTFWNQRRLDDARGFSLPEMMIVVGILAVVGGIAAGSMLALVKDSRADSGMVAAVNALRLARDRAIGERRNVQVRFIPPNQIQIARENIPGPTTTVLQDLFLEDDLEFRLIAGVPDTPDRFGLSGSAVAFGPSATRVFTSEGSFVDSTGDPLNGTLFMAVNGQPTSVRAITILGSTALIHPWSWNGKAWSDK
jgi:prepilin-type N-terminal cleavage/methylation domain-containing protein